MSELQEDPQAVEREELAALAAFGFPANGRVSPDQVAVFQELAARLAALAPPVFPRPSLRDRLMKRVAAFEELKPAAEVRAYDGVWKPMGPGVEFKLLFADPATGLNTTLVRMAPGATLPEHFHHDSEQCLVMEGDIGWGELSYKAGDFVVQGKHTHHPEIRSQSGVLMLIIAGKNEFVHKS